MTGVEIFAVVEDRVRGRDRKDAFVWIRDATEVHRHEHGCWAYPYADGTLLGAVSAATRPARVLELGTALGYTTCWWAAVGAHVDTVERDPLHARLARNNVERADLSASVIVHEGDFDVVVPALDSPYDLIFFDGYEPPKHLLTQLAAPLSPGGVLVTTNLDLGHARTRSALTTTSGWTTHFVADLALSIRA